MKTNTKRSLLLSALVVLFVAMAGLMLINFNFNYSASAAGTFSMGGGAEIFTVLDENVQDLEDINGLRFTTTLTEDFDKSLKVNEGDTVKYYTLVGVGNFTVADLTVDKIDNVNKTVQSFEWTNVEFLDGKHVQNTCVINIPKVGYRDLIVARSYAIVTDANGVAGEPIYATGTDSLRSLEGLANIGMYQDSDDNGMEVYVLGENGQVIVTETAHYLLADREATITLDGLTSKPEKATVYVGVRRVFDATIAEDGSVVLPASYVQSLTKNNAYLITVLDGVNAYRGFISTYDYVMEIATPADFATWYNLQNTNKCVGTTGVSFYTAAYLTNNINMADTTLAMHAVGASASGILDGQGYTISNLTIPGCVASANVNNSLFEASWFMTYTNLAFVNLVGNGGYLFGHNSSQTATVSNCYIEYSTPVLERGINHIAASLKIENTVLVLTQPATTIFRPSLHPTSGVKNFIAVAADSNGAALALPVAYSNSYSVASIEEIVDTDIDWTKWDENYWTIDEKSGIEWTGKAGTVIEEVEIDGVFEKALNRDAKLTIDLTSVGTFAASDVKSVAIDGASAEFTVADNKVTITSAVAAGEHTVKVATTSKVIYASAIVYNYAISDWTELKSFLTDMQGAATPVYGYLENNVTYGHNTHMLSTGLTNIYLDGKGYTIDGGLVRNGFFGQMSGTLKNIALTNIQSSKGSSAQGTISWGDAGMKLENVYIHANYAKNGLHSGATYTCMNYALAATTTYTNVVIHIESPEGVNGYTFSYQNVKWGANNTFTNVYTFSNTAIGIDGDTLNDPTDNIAEDNGIKHFSNINTYRENAQSIIDVLGSDWTLVDGLPTFESAKDLVKETYTFTVDCAAANVVDGVAEIIPGAYALTVGGISLPATYALKAPVTGVSVSGSTVTVADSVAAGTEFTVVGSIYEYMYATTYTAELTFRVLGTTEIADTTVQVAAKNRAGNVTFDMSEYGTFTTDMIQSVSFNDAAIEGATFEGNVLTVPWSGFAPAETTKNMVAVIANGGVTYAVTIPVTAYHFVIGNETEFFNWRNSAGTYASAPNELAPTYAILDANVPLQGTLAGFASSAKRGMVGFLDGNGFTVSNIQITGVEPLFSSAYNFTFKNIGLDITGASYYFFNATGPTPAPGSNHMYNCWINLHSGNHRQFCHLGDIFGSVENLVINWETTSKTVDGYGFFRSSNPKSFSNILATLRTTASDVQMPLFSAAADTTGKNVAVFKTVEEASANLLSETPSFDTSVLSEKYWVIGANGFPVWRNA